MEAAVDLGILAVVLLHFGLSVRIWTSGRHRGAAAAQHAEQVASRIEQRIVNVEQRPPEVEVVTLLPDGETTPVGALRHVHRFGRKDDEGIRHCRCGNRYLDGQVA